MKGVYKILYNIRLKDVLSIDRNRHLERLWETKAPNYSQGTIAQYTNMDYKYIYIFLFYNKNKYSEDVK